MEVVGVYLAGETLTPHNHPQCQRCIGTPGTHQPTYGGGPDAFLAKFSTASGSRFWGTYYGGSGPERAHGCAVDGNGAVYLADSTATSHNSPNCNGCIATPGTHQPSYGGIYDAFLAKFLQVSQGSVYGGLITVVVIWIMVLTAQWMPMEQCI
ncbi:MAG: hypothetical protein RMJ66_04505 [Bacteroidia bacterium]|nr:hypothetical protein [Bacteroidia bacterium]MDW8134308.1 hypothetical protein [Bacteroidia bacterium]